jgi:hypothetical protein
MPVGANLAPGSVSKECGADLCLLRPQDDDVERWEDPPPVRPADRNRDRVRQPARRQHLETRVVSDATAERGLGK